MISSISETDSLKLFVSRSYVEDFFRGKTVAIVGSGPGSLDNPAGLVDSHDVVLRINNYRLFPATGFRTDVHYSFYGTSIKKTSAELLRDGVKLCICKCPDAKFMESEWHERCDKQRGVDFGYIYEDRKDFWFCPTYIPTTVEFLEHFNLLGGHVPTTGAAAIFDVLRYSPKHIFLTGFDFMTSGIHNVTERHRLANPSDPIGHRPLLELAWIRDNYSMFPITCDARLTALLWRGSNER